MLVDVLPADISTARGHEGLAGWTWYTGAAGWLYTTLLSDMLGIVRRGDRLFISPCTGFEEYTVRYRFGGAMYEITVRGGAHGPEEGVALVDDGLHHRIEV